MIRHPVLLAITRSLLLFNTVNLVYNYILCLNTSPGYADSDNRNDIENKIALVDFENKNGLLEECIGSELSFEDGYKATSKIWNTPISTKKSEEFTVSFTKNQDCDSSFENYNGNLEIQYCTKCGAFKYPRTHHCSICNRCILNMDHHCPWIGQCVGLYNRKYFILFLTWSFLSCLLISTLTIPMLLRIISSISGIKGNEDLIFYDNITTQGLLFTAVLSISFAFGTGALFSFHIYLLVTNQSTIEYHRNTFFRKNNNGEQWINEFDRGLSNNIIEVMGTNKFPFIIFPCFN
ncbi:DHHC zinc finger domain-containing protein [Cryptosporidium felis]|nr:DHHC zinc finger domain-containing protein [Cryptosporidium felis]